MRRIGTLSTIVGPEERTRAIRLRFDSESADFVVEIEKLSEEDYQKWVEAMNQTFELTLVPISDPFLNDPDRT